MKKIFKEAFAEFFQEHREWFSEMISEAVEDIAMCNAIREGEKGEFVSRDEIFKFLEMNEWKLNLKRVLWEIEKNQQQNFTATA